MIAFDDNGDIEVDLQGTKGLVSTSALCLSSSVFAKMFHSSFKEGAQQDTASDVRRVISLPEDDPEASGSIAKSYIFEMFPRPAAYGSSGISSPLRQIRLFEGHCELEYYLASELDKKHFN
jgi:hypothetical protein